MPTAYYVVIVSADGGTMAARIPPSAYDDGARALAAASILAGQPVERCISAEYDGPKRCAYSTIPLGAPEIKVGRNSVAAAIGRCCGRQITGDEVDRYLAKPPPVPARRKPAAPVQIELFGAL
jgi:hypothetical protein